jgi:hypothetical protein
VTALQALRVLGGGDPGLRSLGSLLPGLAHCGLTARRIPTVRGLTFAWVASSAGRSPQDTGGAGLTLVGCVIGGLHPQICRKNGVPVDERYVWD